MTSRPKDCAFCGPEAGAPNAGEIRSAWRAMDFSERGLLIWKQQKKEFGRVGELRKRLRSCCI